MKRTRFGIIFISFHYILFIYIYRTVEKSFVLFPNAMRVIDSGRFIRENKNGLFHELKTSTNLIPFVIVSAVDYNNSNNYRYCISQTTK